MHDAKIPPTRGMYEYVLKAAAHSGSLADLHAAVDHIAANQLVRVMDLALLELAFDVYRAVLEPLAPLPGVPQPKSPAQIKKMGAKIAAAKRASASADAQITPNDSPLLAVDLVRLLRYAHTLVILYEHRPPSPGGSDGTSQPGRPPAPASASTHTPSVPPSAESRAGIDGGNAHASPLSPPSPRLLDSLVLALTEAGRMKQSVQWFWKLQALGTRPAPVTVLRMARVASIFPVLDPRLAIFALGRPSRSTADNDNNDNNKTNFYRHRSLRNTPVGAQAKRVTESNKANVHEVSIEARPEFYTLWALAAAKLGDAEGLATLLRELAPLSHDPRWLQTARLSNVLSKACLSAGHLRQAFQVLDWLCREYPGHLSQGTALIALSRVLDMHEFVEQHKNKVDTLVARLDPENAKNPNILNNFNISYNRPLDAADSRATREEKDDGLAAPVRVPKVDPETERESRVKSWTYMRLTPKQLRYEDSRASTITVPYRH
jgi:hypothetical protein